MLTKKDKLFLFGYNPENLLIYKSDKKRNKVIIDNISDGECTELYKKNISFILPTTTFECIITYTSNTVWNCNIG